MPATPSSPRRKRAAAQPDLALPVLDLTGGTSELQGAIPTGSTVVESLPAAGPPFRGWHSARKAADLFRFKDDREKLLEQAAEWIAESMGGLTILFLATSQEPISLEIGAFHPKERWMAGIARGLLNIPSSSRPGLLQQMLDGDKPLLIAGAGEQISLSRENIPESANNARVESLMLIPIKTENRNIGVLACISQQGRQMGEEETALAAALAGMVAAAIDVQSTLRDLRRAIQLRDMSISTASHELRNGLATTRALTQMSLRAIRNENEESKARVENHLEMILRQIDWLTDLTGDVFDVSRIDSGRMELKKEPTSLNSVVVNVIERFRGILAEHTKLRLSVALPNVQLIGSWDRERIDQVLTNLLANAIKYSPKGGLLKVSVEQKGPNISNPEQYNGQRYGSSKTPMAIVALSDQGIGIPSDQLDSIFEPYYRATNVPKELGGGLGLGLHICRGIIEAHGGGLWVESEEGRGSTFYFSLPLEP